jgi:hypothetical protein
MKTLTTKHIVGQKNQMAYWYPRLVFSSVNKKLAWRLLVPMLVVTGISGAGSGKFALPSLWGQILPALRQNVHPDTSVALQPYFAVAFIISMLGIVFLVMVISRVIDIQLFYFAGSASFALSLLWFVCAIMSLLPVSLMGLHQVFVVLVVLATIAAQFVKGGTIRYYWRGGHYGDLATQVVFIGTYLALAWLPLKFALGER